MLFRSVRSYGFTHALLAEDSALKTALVQNGWTLAGDTAGLIRALGRYAGVDLSDPTSGFQALSRRALTLYAGDWFPSDYPDVDVCIVAARSQRAVSVRATKGVRVPAGSEARRACQRQGSQGLARIR